jgi:hypothetical protein
MRVAAQTINEDFDHLDHCVWPNCTEPLAFHLGPLCLYHAMLMYEAVLHSPDVPVTSAQSKVAERRQAEQERAKARARARGQQPGWIYYLRIGDRLKIGYSADVRERMRAYPPESELLAVHPGTRDLEADMHRRFTGSRAAGREWFRETPDLAEHVAQVIAQFGDPSEHRYHFRGKRPPMRRAS